MRCKLNTLRCIQCVLCFIWVAIFFFAHSFVWFILFSKSKKGQTKQQTPVIEKKEQKVTVSVQPKEETVTQAIETVQKPSSPTKVDPFNFKHPLNSSWTFWYFRHEPGLDWEKCQHPIHTVDTVEDFWSLVNHLRPPSDLENGIDYSFFKNGIRPMWEDSQNCKGGRLTICNLHRARSEMIDETWLDLLCFLIGEKYAHTDAVCGIVLNARGFGFKFAVWISNQDRNQIEAIKEAIDESIRESIKSKFRMSSFQTISFELHGDTQKKARNPPKNSQFKWQLK